MHQVMCEGMGMHTDTKSSFDVMGHQEQKIMRERERERKQATAALKILTTK